MSIEHHIQDAAWGAIYAPHKGQVVVKEVTVSRDTVSITLSHADGRAIELPGLVVREELAMARTRHDVCGLQRRVHDHVCQALGSRDRHGSPSSEAQP